MALAEALLLLADLFTRDDDRAGFVIVAGGRMDAWRPQRDMVRAWAAVRRHLGLPVEPRS
jgi:hypothetical protein